MSSIVSIFWKTQSQRADGGSRMLVRLNYAKMDWFQCHSVGNVISTHVIMKMTATGMIQSIERATMHKYEIFIRQKCETATNTAIMT